MKIAYLIMAHDQPELFGRLARAVYAEGVSIYAHIDAKSDCAAFIAASAGLPVGFTPDPVKVNWGGFSQVAAMLRLIEQAVAADEHDYFIFLSGRDFPLYSHGRLVQELDRHPGRSYMNFYPLADGADFVEKIRNHCYHDVYARLPGRFLRRAAGRIVRAINARLPDRSFVAGLQPYRGSTSWCLGRDIAQYIVKFTRNPRNRAYLDFFQSVSCCDEIFFQTIVLNSPYAATLNLYDIDGTKPAGEMKNENKASLHYIDWSPDREDPAILVDRDFKSMYASGKLFARKFDVRRSAGILDRISAVRADSKAMDIA
ncbi:core-2/I-Branching enzyme [Pseudoduganella lurida]|uniref:Peptide O-xylosyltransferase n=1 Tax=Pseudoduganella lurida TaxID=1036180 RepID=A0A562R9Y4_9BURK|nr:beta-1,6-N-acetylglucosaminyltransferase [Pseudoduganella lurida]TWI65196.1 core-2/I-Branching enzyme [Pseudoduganella lurida]